MTNAELKDKYLQYIACLNRQDWSALGEFVHADVCHNDRFLGLAGYRHMLENDYEQISDLHFESRLLVAEFPCIAARLWFEVTPKGEFLGLPVTGRKVAFAENVFYRFQDEKIRHVWSVIDKAAIEMQLRSSS